MGKIRYQYNSFYVAINLLKKLIKMEKTNSLEKRELSLFIQGAQFRL